MMFTCQVPFIDTHESVQINFFFNLIYNKISNLPAIKRPKKESRITKGENSNKLSHRNFLVKQKRKLKSNIEKLIGENDF